ncbi:regucalcin-like isoform X1 [Cylas formicarius]|uniref:regucalcin-like isoform X1 n=1 Tax=Cylas formicarius TaxID=197179 RepID=UPI002958C18D|nr:regucalcin-like isoform X1 [Cylas formicarius]
MGRRWGFTDTITVNKDYSVNIEKKLSNLTLPSGLGWSLDNQFMYHVDAHRGQITKYKFDIDSGKLNEGRVFFDLTNYPHITGELNAIAVKDGAIAVPLYNGSVIINIIQDTAEVSHLVPSPVPLPTSIVFGGPHNKTAYIASSDFRLSELEKRLNPFDSRAVFAYSGYSFPHSPSYRIVVH